MKRLKRLVLEEEGVTLIEYALVAALIAMAAVIALGLVGSAVNNLFTVVAEAFSNAQ